MTKRLIEKKKAKGYSKQFGQLTNGKDWMKPEVKKVIDYMLKRNVFDNSFDSRKHYEDFFLKAVNITVGNKYETIVRQELKLHVGKYIFQIAIKEAHKSKKPRDVELAAEKLKHALKRSIDRAERIGPEVLKIVLKREHAAISKEKLTNENYYRMNARDAFAHRGAEYEILLMNGHAILRAAEEVTQDLKSYK